MELIDYMFLPDKEMWCAYPKAHPHHQAYGESFEELRVKLRHLHLCLSRSTIAPPLANTTVLTETGNDGFLVNRPEG